MHNFGFHLKHVKAWLPPWYFVTSKWKTGENVVAIPPLIEAELLVKLLSPERVTVEFATLMAPPAQQQRVDTRDEGRTDVVCRCPVRDEARGVVRSLSRHSLRQALHTTEAVSYTHLTLPTIYSV